MQTCAPRISFLGVLNLNKLILLHIAAKMYSHQYPSLSFALCPEKPLIPNSHPSFLPHRTPHPFSYLKGKLVQVQNLRF
jgi:hypothetical protein